MQKAKIVISSYDDIKNPFYGGGGAYAVHEVAKSLAFDFKVTVITGKYPGCKDEVIDEVYYKRIGISKVGPRAGQLIFSFSLPFYFLFQKFDLWIESFTPPISTGFLQLFTKKPVIGLVHMLSGEDMKRKYKLPFERIEKLGLKTYKYFIVPTQSIREKILQLNTQARVDVIPNGIKTKSNTKVHSKAGKYILFLGRLEINQKGLDLLLAAFAAISKDFGYKLIIAGAGAKKEEQNLKQMIADLHLSKKVVLTGRVEGNVKESLFKKASFVVIPSRFETFSTVALESMAHGLPIISFGIDGLSWIPKGSSIKVKPFDSIALARAIKTLSEDATLRKRIGTSGWKFSKRNSWDKSLNEYRRYTNQLLSQGSI